jgi:hypothetical protein
MSKEKKKSCSKHKRFNYYCEDCRAANEEKMDKILYPDAISEKGKIKEEKFVDKEIPTTPYERGPSREAEGGPPKEPRYRYTPVRGKRNYKRYLLISVPIIVAIVLMAIFWFIPSWMAGINLQYQLYLNKGGSLNYIEFFTLNFWSSQFIINKTALIGALIACAIMSIPPSRTIFTLIGTQLGWGRTSRLRALIYWWTIGFGIFYLIGQLIDATSYFGWAAYLVEKGMFTLPLDLMNSAFNVLFDSTSTDLTSIFLYSAIYLPIFNFIMGIIIFRIILNLIENIYLKRNDFYAIGDVLILIGVILGIVFFNLPTMSLDGLALLQSAALIVGFIGFIALGITVDIYGFIRTRDTSRGYLMETPQQVRVGIMGVILIVIILFPLFASIPLAVNIESNNVTWGLERWDKQIAREVQWTRICAGLDMFEDRSIENYTSSTIVQDSEILTLVRQYDQSAAVQIMSAQIASKYESIADSDIIYIGGNEYWVSPKTLRMSGISQGGVELHTALFDHVEGFLAMDTYSGDLLTTNAEYLSAFNVSQNYPIFFGEHESTLFVSQYYYSSNDEDFLFDLTGGIGAYDTDILLNTTWSSGIENLKYSYEGEPDGSLVDLEQFWFTANLGLFPYAINLSSSSYLINRNIKTRVRQALLPGLWIDDDPYLIFNINNGKMYYGVSICTEIQIGSYSKSPIYRFLGICLVDVLDGTMEYFKNPTLKENANDDPTYPFWHIYMNKYPWDDAPDWLIDQLRYPENLFERQLAYQYYYHVQDPTTWRRGDDFHERPDNGDLFYIETDLGEGIEYVGIDLVEYVGREAKILAGIYAIRHSDHFGEAILYHTRNLTQINLIGPATARDYYGTAATQEIELITGHRYGNTLLYPLAGTLYYFIPSYATVSGIQELKLAGLVNGFSGETTGYGLTVTEAYAALNLTEEVEEEEEELGNYSFAYTIDSGATDPDPANSRIEIEILDTNITHAARRVIINVSIYSDRVNASMLSNSSLVKSAFTWNGSNVGYNYTLQDQELFPGEGRVHYVQYYANFTGLSVGGIIVSIKYTVIIDGIVTYLSDTETLYFTKSA